MSAPSIPSTVDTHCHCDLLTWKDPLKTGKAFGSILAFLLVFKTVNLLNLFFHLAYIGLLLSAAAEYAGRLVAGQGFVSKYKPSVRLCAKRFNEKFLPQLAKFNESAEKQLQKIVYAQDIESTLKAAGVAYIMYKITSLMSLYALLTVAVTLTFTLPAIYLKNKKQIDDAAAQYSKQAREKTCEITKLAKEKAAPHFEALTQKTGPVGAFLKKNMPTRTAGSTVGDDMSTSFENEKASATASGSSKFPEIPTSDLNKSDIKEFVESGKANIESF